MPKVAKAIQYFDSMDIQLKDSLIFSVRTPFFRGRWYDCPCQDNIFVDSEWHVRIFPEGCLTYLPVEDVRQKNITSLGRTLYEVRSTLTSFCFQYLEPWRWQLYFDVEYPYHYDKNVMLEDLERPSEPEISDELWQVIERCCTGDPKSRPTIDKVVQEMESWKMDWEYSNFSFVA